MSTGTAGARRARRVAVLAALGILLSVALAACSAAPAPQPAPRTRPNALERSAVAAASGFFGPSTGQTHWVQLWTAAQAGPQVERCILRGSNGVVVAQVNYVQGGVGIDFGWATSAGATAADQDRYTSTGAAERLANDCFAATPVDDRIDHVKTADRAALYSYDVTRLRRCLLEHGQRVGAVPTRARFDRLLEIGAAWSPYDHVVVRDRMQWYALADACPVFPASVARDLADLGSGGGYGGIGTTP